ncbi:MAG: response regulator transcription factor [Candidatus Krumholzibacteriota bacterium]|nr:response regulator transcription factor [Candidatus Krumholzibacteriota bacterium]
MPHEHILVVDDEEDILELVAYNLELNGYKVTRVDTGEDTVRVAREISPDLVLLDLMLPGIDGLEVCRILKHDDATSTIPVVMLTARGDESDIVSGLELGADDYIVKPFSPKVLVARIKAVLRRKKNLIPKMNEVISKKDIVIHPGKHEVLIKGKQVSLTSTEFLILHQLARRPGWVFTRNQLIDVARGEDYPVTDRSVDVHIVSLRKKLGSFGRTIETVRGVGYRFREI